MSDLFESPRRMLRHGERHIADLEARINAFTQDKPWAIVREKDDSGLNNFFKVKFTRQLSDDLPHIIFDSANNLRSALDQTAFAVAVRHTSNPKPKSAKFPVGPTEADMLINEKGGCKDLPPEVRALFRSFKAYKGGNNALWALNELCNAPKHQLLYPLQIAGGTTEMKPRSMVVSPREGQIFELHAPRWDREKYELVFARMPTDVEFCGDFNVTFTVALDDVDEVIRNQHPVAVLGAMAREVAEVINLTETACKAVGLIR